VQTEIFHNQGACTLCGRCVLVCPTGANTLSYKSSTIDRIKCIRIPIIPNFNDSMEGVGAIALFIKTDLSRSDID
jgi:ferredoxin